MENGTVISIKKFEFTYEELLNLLKESYRNGYSVYESVNAGLEPYDADGYVKQSQILRITATFDENMADSPVPQISISGISSLSATDSICRSRRRTPSPSMPST